MIQEKMKLSQSRHESYHDKRRKELEFQKRDHIFLRVTPVTGVGRALKSKNLTSCFVGPYLILEKIGESTYRITLPSLLANIYDVFYVSNLIKYILDPSHVIQMDDVKEKDNLTVEALLLRIEGQEVKYL